MALIVEDGTGLPNANSFVTVADVTEYIAKYTVSGVNTVWDALDTAGKERHIQLATQHLVIKYDGRWKGTISTNTQALPWPRAGACDGENLLIDNNKVPQEVKDASAELVLRILSSGELLPDSTVATAAIQSTAVRVGPIAKTVVYASGGASQTTYYRKVAFLLRNLLVAGGRPTLIRT